VKKREQALYDLERAIKKENKKRRERITNREKKPPKIQQKIDVIAEYDKTIRELGLPKDEIATKKTIRSIFDDMPEDSLWRQIASKELTQEERRGIIQSLTSEELVQFMAIYMVNKSAFGNVDMWRALFSPGSNDFMSVLHQAPDAHDEWDYIDEGDYE